MENNKCPNCGNEEFETVKHSWREGVTPYPDTYVCWNCDHEWTDKDIEEKEA